jgi:hypothetical protein
MDTPAFLNLLTAIKIAEPVSAQAIITPIVMTVPIFTVFSWQ